MNLMIAHLLLATFILVLAMPVFAGDISSSDHFEADEMQIVGKQLQGRTIELTPNQRKVLLADLTSRKSPDDESLAKLRSRIATKDESVSYLSFVGLLRSPIILQEFRNHPDPLVRFRVNLGLAASGDTVSANLLCELFSDESVPKFDARAIKTMLMDIGIQPAKTTPDSMIEHLQSLRSGMVQLKPGDSIPNFEAIDTDGNTFSLNDFRGKTVFIHFWATNCVPCMAQMPELRKKLSAIGRGKIETVFVSLDYDKDAAERVGEELKIPCRHVCDGLSVGGDIAKHFRIDRMPVDIVIDAKGKFVSYSLDSVESLAEDKK